MAIFLYCEYKYYISSKNVEVDFYIPDISTGVQVCYSTTKDLNTFEREVYALESLDKIHPLEKMIVITFDEERAVIIEVFSLYNRINIDTFYYLVQMKP